MGYGYRIVLLVLLVLYGYCSVCPNRFFPVGITLQTAKASDSHDCDKSNQHEPEKQCEALSSQYLPSPTAKFVQLLTDQAFVTAFHPVSLVFNFLLTSRAALLSTADPPIAVLNTKLRI
jgi:hypothetical protein